MTPESKFKLRTDATVRLVAKLCNAKVWMTALGVHAKNGIPDKWYQIGGFLFFMEHKRKSKGAAVLQQDRIDMLVEMNQVAFCLAANPESTGAKGQERKDLYTELLRWLEPEQVRKRSLRYVSDCKTLRRELKNELERM